MDLAHILALFATRLAGGYAICLGLIGPQVTEGSWRRVSLYVIAAMCVVAMAAGAPFVPCIATALFALLLDRTITFDVRGLNTTLWMIPFGVWILLAQEWPPSLGTIPSAIAIGGTLGAMLLGHSYLTARGLGFEPLKRMAVLLFFILLVRTAFVVPVFFGDRLPMGDWIYLTMRSAMGLLMPLVFGWMVIRCVRIESNQSATGILYAMTLLVFIGELFAIYLHVERGIAA